MNTYKDHGIDHDHDLFIKRTSKQKAGGIFKTSKMFSEFENSGSDLIEPILQLFIYSGKPKINQQYKENTEIICDLKTKHFNVNVMYFLYTL